MPVQDLIFAVGGFALSAALAPTLLTPHKPALSTCVITGSVVATFAISFASLGLWLAFASNTLNASLWATLAVQVMRRSNRLA